MAMKSIVPSLPPCVSLVSMLTGVPHPHRSRARPEEAGRAATNPSAPCGACTTLFGRQRGAGVVGVRCGGTKTSWPPSVPDTAGLFRSETRVGRGRQGLLLEDDAAVRVQSGRALVSRALWAAKLVASDGRMNVPNERPSVESDEETFIDQHGRSLHLVGADVLHEQERPTLPRALVSLERKVYCQRSRFPETATTSLGVLQPWPLPSSRLVSPRSGRHDHLPSLCTTCRSVAAGPRTIRRDAGAQLNQAGGHAVIWGGTLGVRRDAQGARDGELSVPHRRRRVCAIDRTLTSEPPACAQCSTGLENGCRTSGHRRPTGRGGLLLAVGQAPEHCAGALEPRCAAGGRAGGSG